MTSKQVSTKLKTDRNSATRKLNKLVKFRMVVKRPFLDEKGHFGYKFKYRC
jgi:predicted transcriptional regulator